MTMWGQHLNTNPNTEGLRVFLIFPSQERSALYAVCLSSNPEDTWCLPKAQIATRHHQPHPAAIFSYGSSQMVTPVSSTPDYATEHPPLGLSYQLIQDRSQHGHWDISIWRAAQRASSAVVVISHRAVGHIGTETKIPAEKPAKTEIQAQAQHGGPPCFGGTPGAPQQFRDRLTTSLIESQTQ